MIAQASTPTVIEVRPIRDMTTNDIVHGVSTGELAFGITSFVQHDPELDYRSLLKGKMVAAIPAVIAYNKISSDIGRYTSRLEGFAAEFAAIVSRQLDEAE